MSNLITVPNFIFSQGDVFDGDEWPIQVCYYNGKEGDTLIELKQEDRYINFTNLQQLKKLVKEVEKHHDEASKKLSK